jgi:hypothetical protein
LADIFPKASSTGSEGSVVEEPELLDNVEEREIVGVTVDRSDSVADPEVDGWGRGMSRSGRMVATGCAAFSVVLSAGANTSSGMA